MTTEMRAQKRAEPPAGPVCHAPAQDARTTAKARAAQLNFSADCMPGIARVRRADGGFDYRRHDGRNVGVAALRRVEQLKIPPAWTDVWISEDERGHLQATGRDSRGRKQYLYHAEWRALRDESKYERMVAFGEALGAIRQQVARDLGRSAAEKRRVLALVVAVLDRSLVRIGNREYVRDNETFGLTTLRSEHVEVSSTRVQLRFRGKSGKHFDASISDPQLARVIRRLRDLPGQELFQFVDESGQARVIGSADVNEYLREAGGREITSKDFRTWGGSLAAADALRRSAGEPSERSVTSAVKAAADVLGNTPAVCRRSYIHPGLIRLYLQGGLETAWQAAQRDEPANPYLADCERAFLGVLRRIEDATGDSSA